MADKTYGEGFMTRRDFLGKLAKLAGIGIGFGTGIISLEKALSTMTGRKEWPDTPFFKIVEDLYRKESANPEEYLDTIESLISKIDTLPESIEGVSLRASWKGGMDQFSLDLGKNQDNKPISEILQTFRGIRKQGQISNIFLYINYNFVAKVHPQELDQLSRKAIQSRTNDNYELVHSNYLMLDFALIGNDVKDAKLEKTFVDSYDLPGEVLSRYVNEWIDKDGKIIKTAELVDSFGKESYSFMDFADLYTKKAKEAGK